MIIGPTYVKGICRGDNGGMIHHRAASMSGMWLLLAATTASGQRAPAAPAPGQTCAFVTQAHADASAGTPNVNHDGSPLPGTPAPDISRGFQGIPRSAQPPLTATQRRILECSYRLVEADAEMPYALFVPSGYSAGTPAPLIIDLHGLNITPLMQMLFDGTTDLAERYGFIVVAPMGFSLSGWWGARSGRPGELSELDAMKVLDLMRQRYAIDRDRIYLMGHSMGGAGTYHLGGKYPDIWAGIAPISGAGGIDPAAAEHYRSFATLLMHGEKDSIVSVTASRRAAMVLQGTGAQHIYLEFPGKDHEFWIRRGAENMEKVFLFFSTVSKRTSKGFITPEKIQ
jgi:pimeloyl-ACP methyl ester carboxylesterase